MKLKKGATQRHMLRWDRWLSAFDLMRLTAGAGKELDIHAHTIQRVCRAYVEARHTHRKPWLRFRGRKSLGWVPFNTGHISFDGEAFRFRGDASARYSQAWHQTRSRHLQPGCPWALVHQVCSECGCLPPSRPKGIAHLGIREWHCDDCGTVHHRDVNAAKNILAIGLNSLIGGAHV